MTDKNSTATRTSGTARASGRANGAAAGESLVSRLAGFFPGAVAVRIPVKIRQIGPSGDRAIGPLKKQGPDQKQYQVPGTQYIEKAKTGPQNGNGAGEASENTVIEFGTAQEALFACSLPLEFEDRVRLENPDGTLQTDGDVVAVQYHEGRTAVAVRFARKMANWIIR